MKEDLSPTRVKPFPLLVLMHCYMHLQTGNTKAKVIADLIVLVFFCLLRPGEYQAGGTDAVANFFLFKDVTVYKNQRRVKLDSACWKDVNFSQLHLTTQKKYGER